MALSKLWLTALCYSSTSQICFKTLIVRTRDLHALSCLTSAIDRLGVMKVWEICFIGFGLNTDYNVVQWSRKRYIIVRGVRGVYVFVAIISFFGGARNNGQFEYIPTELSRMSWQNFAPIMSNIHISIDEIVTRFPTSIWNQTPGLLGFTHFQILGYVYTINRNHAKAPELNGMTCGLNPFDLFLLETKLIIHYRCLFIL